MAGNGARQIWLKATREYAVDPIQRVWAVLGTGTHSNLARLEYGEGTLQETEFDIGTADLLEPDEQNPGSYVLTDGKIWGSFKVAKSLGIKTVDVNTGEYFKTGAKAGQQKTRKEIIYDPTIIDLRSEQYQLSSYAYKFQDKGYPISRMQLMIIVRDGGTAIAKGRGIDLSLYLLPLELISRDEVYSYYGSLEETVLRAFKGEIPPMCSPYESWDGRRCSEQYCDVYNHCKEL
jgi:hypothetical protein